MFVALRRVHVAASDFPRSRRFYGETLGLPETGGFENDWVEYGLGPVLLKLTPLPPGQVPARNQVAAVLSTATLEEALTTLKDRGVTVTRSPQEEFTGRSAEILDPDGYRIVVFQASDLHPDEEWVPMSRVDELVKQKLHARRLKEKGKGAGTKTAKKAAPKKSAAKKKAAPKKAAARKAAPKKSAKKSTVPKQGRKPAPKKKSPAKKAKKKTAKKKK